MARYEYKTELTTHEKSSIQKNLLLILKLKKNPFQAHPAYVKLNKLEAIENILPHKRPFFVNV